MLFFSNNQSFNLLFSQIFAKYFEILNLITYILSNVWLFYSMYEKYIILSYN